MGAGTATADPTAIQQRIDALQHSSQARLLKQPLAQARDALERAREARAAGDLIHGVELEALANDWLDLAGDLTRAVALERQVDAVQRKLADTVQTKQRTETLLEETVAQRERSRLQLRRVLAKKDAGDQAPLKTPSPKGQGPGTRP